MTLPFCTDVDATLLADPAATMTLPPVETIFLSKTRLPFDVDILRSPAALIVPLTFMPIVPVEVLPTRTSVPAPVWLMVPLCWKPTALLCAIPVKVAIRPADILRVRLAFDPRLTPVPEADCPRKDIFPFWLVKVTALVIERPDCPAPKPLRFTFTDVAVMLPERSTPTAAPVAFPAIVMVDVESPVKIVVFAKASPAPLPVELPTREILALLLADKFEPAFTLSPALAPLLTPKIVRLALETEILPPL